MIRVLIDRAADYDVLDYIGASPLEDLVNEHRARLVDRIATQAATDPRLRGPCATSMRTLTYHRCSSILLTRANPASGIDPDLVNDPHAAPRNPMRAGPGQMEQPTLAT